MSNAFSRSWDITLLSFGVINKDKELLLFPLFAGIFSFLFMAVMLVPTVLTSFLEGAAYSLADYVIIFVTYLGLAFVATFFNVCAVYTTKIRFDGGNATFRESIKFAVSRIRLIFYWSLIAATVGLLLRILDAVAERAGASAQIVLNILTSFLGLMWSIVTIFVVPGMVYHNLEPMEAINKSVETLKKTWGESLIRYFGLGFIQFLFFVLGLLVAIVLMFLLGVMGPGGIIAALVITVVYFLVVILVFGLATTIFNTALYVYADTGQIPAGYSQEIMSNAFRRSKR